MSYSSVWMRAPFVLHPAVWTRGRGYAAILRSGWYQAARAAVGLRYPFLAMSQSAFGACQRSCRASFVTRFPIVVWAAGRRHRRRVRLPRCSRRRRVGARRPRHARFAARGCGRLRAFHHRRCAPWRRRARTSSPPRATSRPSRTTTPSKVSQGATTSRCDVKVADK